MANVYTEMIDELGAAKSLAESAEHLVFVVLPVVGDNKLLLRALESTNKAVLKNIEVVLKFEHMFKRIDLTKNPGDNLDLFFSKCISRYGLNELEILGLREILKLGKRHKDSGFEFSRYRKVIIMQDKGEISELGAENMVQYARISLKLAENSLLALRRCL
jgi:hypothetical protein